MNRDIERAVFRRVYDGMAGKDGIGRDALAECVWMAAKEQGQKREKELLQFVAFILQGCEQGAIKAKPFLDFDAVCGDAESVQMQTIAGYARRLLGLDSQEAA